MEVYVVRHGEAEPAPRGGADVERSLTAAGSQALAGVALGLRSLGVGFDRLFASPLRRARETAAVLAEGLDGPVPEELAALGPGHGPELLLGELAGAGGRVALVGHQPVLGMLVSLAVTGVASDGFTLAPGSVVRVDFEGAPRPGAGRVRWMLRAEQLARLGGADSA